MTPAEAELEARRHLGGTLRAKEEMRDARVMTWLEAFARDLRHGARLFRRQPGTTFLAVLTLSLGIGANAVIFSLLHAVLLRPLPFPAADRLVSIVDNFRTEGTTGVSPTVPELLDVRAASTHLQGFSFYDMRDVQTTGGLEPARAFAARIEPSFHTVLGVRPQLGRLFVEGEGAPGRDRVVILTDGFWRRNFGADPHVVGREIIVNGAPNTVVGVLPPDFAFDYIAAEPIELYIPFPMNNAYLSRGADFGNVRRVISVARLQAGSTRAEASAEVQGISRTLSEQYPALYRRGSDGRDLGFSMTVEPLKDTFTGRSRAILLLLFGAVGLVLLIACVNTAQFLLARAVERQQEVAVRSALGAGRSRLVRQFLAEAFLLAFIACGAGLVQAVWLANVLDSMLASRSRFDGTFEINGPVIAFSIAVTLVMTAAFGLFPALHFSRVDPRSRLYGHTTGVARTRTRQVMIALEVAISIVLLVAAGLLVQSLRQLQNAPPGYSAADVTVMRMRVSPRAAAGSSGRWYQQYLERISAVPGVAAAAVADAPLAGFPGMEFSIIGREDDAATLSRQRASWRIVSPGYFSTLRIPLLAGRTFAEDDVSGRPPVAIINEEMARHYWPGQSPIGQQIRSGIGPRAAVTTIVGVVGNVRPLMQSGAVPQIYVSYLQQSEPSITLLVRGAPGAVVMPDAIKQAVWSAVPDQPLFDIRPMTDVVAQPMTEPRIVAQLLASFALLALIMSAMGVYTVVTYLTSRRSKEVALRRAIGAAPFDVLRLLAGQTLRWTVAGLAVGIVAAVAANGALRAALFGLTRVDPATIAMIASMYLVVVAVAVCVPAARALRLDPARVLRAE